MIRAFVLVSTLVFSLSAVASEVSTTHEKSLLDDLYFNYFAIYHGPSTHDLSSPYTVDANGKKSKFATQNFDSTVTAAYMVTQDIGVGPYVPFLLSPMMGQGFTLGDVGATAFDKKVFTGSHGFVAANLILQAPTSDASSARKMSVAVKSTPYGMYFVPGMPVTLGVFTELKDYLGVTSDKTFKLWASPFVSYGFSKSFAVKLMYEMEAHHDVGMAGAMSFRWYQSDLEPGIVWNITSKIFVNPYFQVYTTNNANSDRTALGALISASM